MKKVIALIVLTGTIFATMEVALKTAGNNLDPLQLTAIRFLIGGLFLAPFAIPESREKGYRLNVKDVIWMSAVGIMGIPVSMLAFQIGVMNCNAATASSLICTNPLFAMVIAHLFTTEKMDRRKWIAFGLGIIAVIFMIRPWDVQEGNSFKGIVIMLFSAATFGAYSVMGKRSIGRIGTFMQTSVSFIMGSLILLVFTFVLGHPVISGVGQNIGVVLYAGIVVTGIGYLSYFTAIKESDASTGSIAFFVKPAIAPIFAITILGETIYWNTVVGIILLIFASVLTIIDAIVKRSAEKSGTAVSDHN